MTDRLVSRPATAVDGADAAGEYRLLYELPFIGMAVTSAATKRWVQVNEALCDLLGYSRAELIDRSWVGVSDPETVDADVAAFDRALREQSDGYRRDKRYVRSDGTILDVSVDVKAVRAPDGTIDCFVATIYDITARVSAERAAREAAELLGNLSRHIPGVIFQFLRRPDGSVVFPFVSDAIREICEIEPEMAAADGWTVFNRTHPDDQAMVAEAIDRSRRTLQPWHCDYRVLLPRKGVRWLRGDAQPERLPDGSTLWHGFIKDSTERQLARQALVASEERYRVQIEHAPEAIVVYDVERRRFVDCNTNAERLLGLTRAAMLECGIVDVSPPMQPDGRPSVEAGAERIGAALAGETPVFEWVHRHSSGREIPSEVRLVRLPSVTDTLVRGSITDITERTRAAEELTRLDAAIASSINGVAIADLGGTLQFANGALLELWGYQRLEDVLGRSVESFWSDPAETARTMAELERTGRSMGEMVAIRADGVRRLFQVNASLFPDASGRRVGMLASFADITDARNTERTLRVRDEAIRTAMTAIAIGDPTGKPVYVNPAFVQLWGYDNESEVYQREVLDFLAEGVSLQKVNLDRLFTNGSWQGELRARRKDGSQFDMLAAANLIRDEQGNIIHLMGSFLDITESKRLQAEVLQAQKMESVGRLAGGVAHDFNNLLTVMKGCLDLALESPGLDVAVRNELLEVNRAANSATELTRQLLAFSRKQIISPAILDLNDVVYRVHGMLTRLLGEHIRLQVVTGANLGSVSFDPSQAEQILVNLAVNARDAMPDGGTLTVETSHLHVDAEYARSHPGMAPGDYALLTVSDTGIGMSPETSAHVFEPFFTTKDLGSGTGLGLAMIHGAVSQNGGRVEVRSELGRGTSFRIILPRVDTGAPLTAESHGRANVARGTETLVLVEDDAAVRQLMVRQLERQGYRVVSFSGGAAMLEWLRDWTEPVDLLITDVIMPGMNGRLLVEQLSALRPETRVLYASGYTADVIAQQGVLAPGVEFLAKPFAAAELAATVRDLLDRP